MGNRRKKHGQSSTKWARKQEKKLRSADSLASSNSSIRSPEASSTDDLSSSAASTVLADSTELSRDDSTKPDAVRAAALTQLLDVEVEVSAGRWEVEGQYLKWYISKAEAIAEDAGNPTNGVFRHSIKVKRRGGPVKHEMSGSAWDVLTACGFL